MDFESAVLSNPQAADTQSPPCSSDDEFAALLEAELQDEPPQEAPEISPTLRNQPGETSFGTPDERSPLKRRRTGTSPDVSPICPPHPGAMHGICIRCGAAFFGSENDQVALRYIHHGLQITKAEAERIRAEGLQRTLDKRKLLLVLDLDHTLLNSTRFSEVSSEQGEQLNAILELEEGKSDQTLFRMPQMGMWTKLRPYVRQFLEASQKIAEMHVYTHGDREYAAAMAALLDPSKKYFHERIISQADSTQRHVKNLDIMLGAESAVVILDDTEGVWPDHKDNLIQVERYLFFPADAKRFHTGQSCLLERGEEESADQGQLSVSLQVLQGLHERLFCTSSGLLRLSKLGTQCWGALTGYYAGAAAGGQDVRLHLGSMRSSILDGVRACFTKIIPVGVTNPELHPVWQLAEKLGVHCSLRLEEGITHLIAGDSHTEKAIQARERGILIVSPEWLHASALLWRRANEERFPPPNTRAVRDEQEDLRAALASAGGGRGSDVESADD